MKLSHLESYKKLTPGEKKQLSLNTLKSGLKIVRVFGMKGLPRYYSNIERAIIKEAWYVEWGLNINENKKRVK